MPILQIPTALTTASGPYSDTLTGTGFNICRDFLLEIIALIIMDLK